jgi:hypothetical protein
MLVIEVDFREIKRETAQLNIPDPGKRITYYGCVIRVERVIPRVKPFRIRGVTRYGAVQIVLPKEAVDKPAYVIVYVLCDKDQYFVPETSAGRSPLVKVTS